MDSKGYYSLLGISEHASYQEIKRAYRGLARKYHPDRNNSSFAEDIIKKINASFEVLSDRDKRREYDTTGFTTIQIDRGESNNENNDTHDQVHASDRSASSSRVYSSYNPDDNNHYGARETHNDSISNDGSDARIQTTITDLDTPKGRFHIVVEPSLCMAFGELRNACAQSLCSGKEQKNKP